MWDNLFSAADLLQNGLEASWARNAVIRNNIANVETPNFKSSDVEFESVLLSALQADGTSFQAKKTNERHISFGNIDSALDVSYVVTENDDTSMLVNGNNVDIEAENVKLAQNSILYNTILTKLNGELARLKMAISEPT